MNYDDAPGPVGFKGVLFFQLAWDIVGVDVCNVVMYFFRTGFLQLGLNSNFLTLISKVDKADAVENYRPIVLANFLFKIISKILSNQFSDVVSRIISPNQLRFIKGRQIQDYIVTFLICVNLMDRKCFVGLWL